MANIIFTGDERATSYVSTPFITQFRWLQSLSIIGLDTETNVVDSILNRLLKVISIADESGDNIWVIEWEHLKEVEQNLLVQELRKKLCIIQNVSFDYKMFKKQGVILEKVYDTMLAEQVLTNGYSSEKGYHGLAGIYQRRFELDISKDEQLTFGEGPYSDEQIQYAAVDVLKLGALRKIQLSEMKYEDIRIKQKGRRGLVKTLWWENEFVKAVADMEMTGVLIDKDKWYAIEDTVRPIFDRELAALNQIVVDKYWDVLEENGWISSKDEFVTSVWSSAAKKKLVLAEIYTFPIEKTAKTELKKLLQENDPDFPEGLKLSGKAWTDSDYPTTFNSKYAVLKLLILSGKDAPTILDALQGFLMNNMKSFCIEQGWIRPANKLSMNWASPAQRLKVFQAIDPSIQSTAKDVISEYIEKDVIFVHYLAWSEVEYQLKSFGKGFYDKHVEVDGKHRTRFNQILATGRLSSVSPNMLNIPRKQSAYRAAIIPDEGFELIDADYDGQELVITTEISQEPSWMEYAKKGYDLHSKNAELIFGEEWLNATEPDCAYYDTDIETDDSELIYPADGVHPYKKCNCKGHVEMRDNSKAVSFGKEKMHIFAPNQRCYG